MTPKKPGRGGLRSPVGGRPSGPGSWPVRLPASPADRAAIEAAARASGETIGAYLLRRGLQGTAPSVRCRECGSGAYTFRATDDFTVCRDCLAETPNPKELR